MSVLNSQVYALQMVHLAYKKAIAINTIIKVPVPLQQATMALAFGKKLLHQVLNRTVDCQPVLTSLVLLHPNAKLNCRSALMMEPNVYPRMSASNTKL